MTPFDEALAGREAKYAGWSDDKLRADARGDVLRLLNVFTDVQSPTMADVQVVHMLAEAACALHTDQDPPAWAEAYPEAAEAWGRMAEAFGAFMAAKAAGRYAVDLIGPVFTCHRQLARAVQSITTSEEEKQAIMNAVKK